MTITHSHGTVNPINNDNPAIKSIQPIQSKIYPEPRLVPKEMRALNRTIRLIITASIPFNETARDKPTIKSNMLNTNNML